VIERYRDIAHIKGWFGWYDYKLFKVILASQAESAPGTLVELGAYMGKSAVVIGDSLREGEEFVVLDLFGANPDLADYSNRDEIQTHYRTLSQEKFEENYRSIHDEVPTVVRGPSSQIMEHVKEGSVRFCHVDASHLYGRVMEDAENAGRMMRPGGVAVFDDYRSAHTPGVAAVVWNLVTTGRFTPIVLTPQKMYGAFAEPDAAREAVGKFVRDSRLNWEEQDIAGSPVIRIVANRKAKASQANSSTIAKDGVEKLMRDEYSRAVESLSMTVQAQLLTDHQHHMKEIQRIVETEIESHSLRAVGVAMEAAIQGEAGKHLSARIAKRVAHRLQRTSEASRLRRLWRELRRS